MATPDEKRNLAQDGNTARPLPASNGIGELLMNNPMVMQAPQPTMEQPKVEENKSLWRSFLDKVQNDPNTRMALMSMGANMLRSPGFGQGIGDVAGNAIAQGMSTYMQGRQFDAQQQLAGREQTRKEQDSTVGNEVAQKNAQSYGTAVQQQGEASRASATNAAANTAIAKQQANLEAEIAPRRVAAQETQANAAMKTANAAGVRAEKVGTAGSTGQNVQLVNQRKTALMAMNPGMSDDEATLQAQNDILMSKTAGNPAAIAKGLFDSQLKAWQGNFDNIGKTPSSEVLEQMKQSSMSMAKEFSKLNSKGTPTTATSGQIQRTTSEEPASTQEAESVVGRKVKGLNGQLGEITGQAGDVVTIRLPNGKEITQPFEAISAYILAE